MTKVQAQYRRNLFSAIVSGLEYINRESITLSNMETMGYNVETDRELLKKVDFEIGKQIEEYESKYSVDFWETYNDY